MQTELPQRKRPKPISATLGEGYEAHEDDSEEEDDYNRDNLPDILHSLKLFDVGPIPEILLKKYDLLTLDLLRTLVIGTR